ncbi:MAG: uroporphyrinogen-III decarboxylase-like protein [Planctomycetota bacterium]|nr:uroporphyrinogen-III decarboxylase-like protein [Planctomycetota bacterium]
MEKREVVRLALEGQKPPYVPWHYSFTVEVEDALLRRYGSRQAMDEGIQNHFVGLGSDIGFFEDLGDDHFRDVFGVVWDRRVDKDIGVVVATTLKEPTLSGYSFPDPADARFFQDIPELLARYPDRWRVFRLGFSLYERAWTLRGMENLMADFLENPEFVRDLFDAICDYNLAQVDEALKYDIDAVYFGDDWGMQTGLQMGPALWREFVKPVLQRMYGRVKDAGKKVMIHSCGKVDELFDDLVGIGLDCFNPFQPEVMDVFALLKRYRGRLAFHGGLSTQRTLPYGSRTDVRNETERLLAAGRDGGFILSPAHSVEDDVPLENVLEFITVALEQKGAPKGSTGGS